VQLPRHLLCALPQAWAGPAARTGGPRRSRAPGVGAERPNELWLTDITEHRTDEGKLYLCAITDAWSNRILGYTIDDRMKLLIDCEEDRTLGGIGTIDKLLDEWQSQIALDRRRSRCATHSWRSTLPRAVAPLPGAARRARGLRKRIDGESIHRAAKRYGELHERGISRHT